MEGDVEALLDVLDPAVVGEFDSGGAFPGAAMRPIVGRDRVLGRFRRVLAEGGFQVSVADVNGEPGVLVTDGERIISVISLEVRDGRIHHIHGVGNPAKLAHLVPAPAPDQDRPVLAGSPDSVLAPEWPSRRRPAITWQL